LTWADILSGSGWFRGRLIALAPISGSPRPMETIDGRKTAFSAMSVVLTVAPRSHERSGLTACRHGSMPAARVLHFSSPASNALR
jgi:hypothetical protein